MRIERLQIEGFRNLQTVDFTPDPAVNVIYGDNAQGKTNLVEAIYLLSGQKSFRSARDAEMIRFGGDFARISADFQSGGRTQNVVLTISGKKTATHNEIPITPGELTGQFLSVVFSPGELTLIQDGPAERRSFLDGAISQVMPRYLATLNTMNRVLLQRNTLLADMVKAGCPEAMTPLLETWDQNFSRVAYSIFHARSRFIDRLLPPAAGIYREIAGENGAAFSLVYQPGIAPPQGKNWGDMTATEGESHIREALLRARSEDYKNYCTTAGPHRDNMEVLLDGISARVFGSQGQQRSCALALKLAQCRVIEETLGESPIILLDDVLSELDHTRRDYFLKGEHRGQVFITCCDRNISRSIKTGLAFRMKAGLLSAPKAPTVRKSPKKKEKA